MNERRFDTLARFLGAPSRRSLLTVAGGLALTALLGRDAEQTAARRKRKKQKKHKKEQPSSPPVPLPPTCSQTCAGCCAGETCQDGTSKAACGRGGAACATCAGDAPLCIDQTCQPCDVCGSGCQYPSVHAAIAAALPGETIRLCAGVYDEDITIAKSLTLIGAGDGNGAGNTLLQGTGTDTVVKVTDAAQSVTLRSLRITGGSAPSPGGAISNYGDELTLVDCTLTGNHAVNTGGAIGNALGSTLNLIRCTVSGNTAGGGAGIDNQGTVVLTNSTITGNETPIAAGYLGGGIYSGNVVKLDAASRVTGNKAGNGGGIYNAGGAVQLSSADNVTGNTPNNCAGAVVPLCAG